MRDGLKSLIEWLPDQARIAEIGCYAGESASIFLASGKVCSILAVDDWQSGGAAEPMFDEALQRFIEAGRVTKWKMASTDAARMVAPGSLDFVYIDAGHRYEDVRADIRAWLPKVKPGGLIGGHDYAFGSNAIGKKYGVVRAVHERFFCPDLVFEDSSWLVSLSGARANG